MRRNKRGQKYEANGSARDIDAHQAVVSEAVVTEGASHYVLPEEDLTGSSSVVPQTIIASLFTNNEAGVEESDISDSTIIVHQIPHNASPLTFSFEMDGKYKISISTKACKTSDIIPTDNPELLLQFSLILQHIINLHDGEHKITFKDKNIRFASGYSDISECRNWFEVFSQPGDKITIAQAHAWILSVQDLLIEMVRNAFDDIIVNHSVDNLLYGGFNAELHEAYNGQCHDVGITTDNLTAITMHFLLDNRYEVSVAVDALIGKQITSDNKKLLLQISCIVQTIIDSARQNHKDHSITVADEIVGFAANYTDQSEYKNWVEACKKPDDLDNPDSWIISVQDLFLSLARKAVSGFDQVSEDETLLVGEFKVELVEHFSGDFY